jgi:hypothetical protein
VSDCVSPTGNSSPGPCSSAADAAAPPHRRRCGHDVLLVLGFFVLLILSFVILVDGEEDANPVIPAVPEAVLLDPDPNPSETAAQARSMRRKTLASTSRT